jgi:hypothetical protein
LEVCIADEWGKVRVIGKWDARWGLGRVWCIPGNGIGLYIQ